MRKLGSLLFSAALLSAFTLGFSPSVAWAAGSPGGSVNEILRGERQLEVNWTPTIPVGLSLPAPDEASPPLAQQGGGQAAPPPRAAGGTTKLFWTLGMWLTIGGAIGMTVGIILAVAAPFSCGNRLTYGSLSGCYSMWAIGVTLAVLGALTASAGITLWVIAAVRRGQGVGYVPQPQDPWTEQALARSMGDGPPVQNISGYSFAF